MSTQNYDSMAPHARSLLSELLEDSKLYKSGQDYQEMLDFVVRLRNFAPFNAFILHIQKPGLRFAASRRDWLNRFRRTVRPGARPLLILWPFAPLVLVYDVEDTEGDPLPHDVAEAFRAIGAMTDHRIARFLELLGRQGIETQQIEFGDGLAGNIGKLGNTMEVIKRIPKTKEKKDTKEKPHYRIRLNKAHDPNIRFATLIHELAHLYLGHLGEDDYLKIPDRSGLTHGHKELEAESVCYMICRRSGVEPDSDRYLANYVRQDMTVEHFDLYALLKTAGQIETVLELTAHNYF
ncbi:ImmA/IrrE family metallo-endopeptidase [Methylotuvimicrobium sp. KM2]|uniref:ImmA/IrrE family metallo-endopeptidase n=1 Tax=Methylotuvimicrobium sp. KM2 TaxID=3133976 RepID=UPI00310173EB